MSGWFFWIRDREGQTRDGWYLNRLSFVLVFVYTDLFFPIWARRQVVQTEDNGVDLLHPPSHERLAWKRVVLVDFQGQSSAPRSSRIFLGITNGTHRRTVPTWAKPGPSHALRLRQVFWIFCSFNLHNSKHVPPGLETWTLGVLRERSHFKVQLSSVGIRKIVKRCMNLKLLCIYYYCTYFRNSC